MTQSQQQPLTLESAQNALDKVSAYLAAKGRSPVGKLIANGEQFKNQTKEAVKRTVLSARE